MSTYDTLQSYAQGYQIFLYINCAIICILYPIFILSIIYSDKKLNLAYKCLFYCCATTSLVKSILQALWAPILTPKFFGVVVTGVAKSLGPEANLWFFQVALIMLTNSQLCTAALLIFQFSHLTPTCNWSRLGKNTTVLACSHVTYMLTMVTASLLTVRYAVNSREAFNDYVYGSQSQFGLDLLNHGETSFSFIAKYNPASYALATLVLASTTFLCLTGCYYTWILSKVICKTMDLVSEQTYKLEMIMWRTFIYKTGMMLGFFLLPMLAYAITIWADIESPLISVLANVVFVSHGWISYVIGFFFIGPYRRFVTKIVTKSLTKTGYSSNSSVITPSGVNPLFVTTTKSAKMSTSA